jgi:hypothetical protein
MGSPGMVIAEVARENPHEMPFVQDDHLIEHLAPDTTDEPFDVRILPW